VPSLLEICRGLAPQFSPAAAEIGVSRLVLLHAHAVGDRQFRAPLEGLGIIESPLSIKVPLESPRQFCTSVALALHFLEQSRGWIEPERTIE